MANHGKASISICVPTFNRADCLPQLLESIAAQYTDDIELIISDNASTDSTAVVVAGFQARIARLVYSRADENRGMDHNIRRAIDLASADFCWLMGSDDKVEPGAIALILSALRKDPLLSGISVAARGYSPDLKNPIFIRDPVAAFPKPLLLTDADEVASLIGPSLGFISSLVVRRDVWRAAIEEISGAEFPATYAHLYTVVKMLTKAPRWSILPIPCVGWRSGNDSFLGDGRFRRLQIDVLGFEKAFALLGRASVGFHAVQVRIATVHVRWTLIGGKLTGEKSGFFLRALTLTVPRYGRYPAFWIKTFPIFLTPSWLMRGARWLYRHMLKPARDRNAALSATP